MSAPEAPKPVTPPTPTPTPPPADAKPADPVTRITDDVVGVLRATYDPEIPVNIYELGLVYGVDVTPEGAVAIRMTLTSPACPVAGSLPGEVETRVAAIPGVSSAKVDLVWDPPWDVSKLSEAARLQLGMM